MTKLTERVYWILRQVREQPQRGDTGKMNLSMVVTVVRGGAEKRYDTLEAARVEAARLNEGLQPDAAPWRVVRVTVVEELERGP